MFQGIGPEGQAKIRAARVLVVGCGALGSSLAEMMARAGVGTLTVADRDYLEESNLQRQSLFDERDLAAGLPKAAAAEAKLRAINSDVRVVGLVADVSADNAAELVRAADLVLDGTDNFETRFLINDVCVREGVPWVYGACVGSYGAALAVRPKTTPCLRCLLEEPPPPGSAPTCDNAGVIAPIVHVVAGIQAGEALKLLAGRTESLLAGLVTVDLWPGGGLGGATTAPDDGNGQSARRIHFGEREGDLGGATTAPPSLMTLLDLRGRAPWCPACTQGRFEYAERASGGSAVLCGRDAVQVRPPRGASIDLPLLAGRLSAVGRVSANEHLVRFTSAEGEMVVFRDGRAIVKGVSDPAQARSLYAKYVGS